MKPRFSILTLLGVKVYVAINVLVAMQPTSSWNAMLFYVWLALLLKLCLEASRDTTPKAVFARGLVGGTLIYTVGALVESYASVTEPGSFSLPHTLLYWAVVSLTEHDSDSLTKVIPQRAGYFRWIILNSGLAFGLYSGSLALWRYRALERREKTEQAGE